MSEPKSWDFIGPYFFMGRGYWVVFNGDGEQVGYVFSDTDAKLIAAAPKMYEALKKIDRIYGHNVWSRDYGWMPAVKDAIAKAEGLTE